MQDPLAIWKFQTALEKTFFWLARLEKHALLSADNNTLRAMFDV